MLFLKICRQNLGQVIGLSTDRWNHLKQIFQVNFIYTFCSLVSWKVSFSWIESYWKRPHTSPTPLCNLLQSEPHKEDTARIHNGKPEHKSLT